MALFNKNIETNMKTKKVLILFLLFPFFCLSQNAEKIKWYSFNETAELQKKQTKKIFIDVYTDWCGWCKKMDASTFSHPVIAKLMNKYFYAVKLDAEKGDTIFYNNQKYGKRDSNKKTPNDFAAMLLNGKMSYPTTVYLDEAMQSLGPVPGYLEPQMMEKILVFFGENHYKTTEWKVFEKNFKGEIVVEEHGY